MPATAKGFQKDMSASSTVEQKNMRVLIAADNSIGRSKPVRRKKVMNNLKDSEKDVADNAAGTAHDFENIEIIDETIFRDLEEFSPDEAPGLIIQLIEIFIAEAPNRCAAIEQAVRSGDRKQIEYAAHRFKGSCAGIGAARAAARCAALERRAFDGEVANGQETIDSIKQDTGEAIKILEAVSYLNNC